MHIFIQSYPYIHGGSVSVTPADIETMDMEISVLIAAPAHALPNPSRAPVNVFYVSEKHVLTLHGNLPMVLCH